jgi:sarcosine oxidase, subunit gamma
MFKPVAQSPLHALAAPTPASDAIARCGVLAWEMPLFGYISLRGNAGDPAFMNATARVLAMAVPTEPCTFTQSDTQELLWLSPDEWMIVCPRAKLDIQVRDLGQALAGTRHQVIDNSGGYTQVRLHGPNAIDVLRHASVYDFSALGPGRVIGTTFGKSSVYVYRADDGFCLLLRRSFADYLWRFLTRAAEPYGFGVSKPAETSP